MGCSQKGNEEGMLHIQFLQTYQLHGGDSRTAGGDSLPQGILPRLVAGFVLRGLLAPAHNAGEPALTGFFSGAPLEVGIIPKKATWTHKLSIKTGTSPHMFGARTHFYVGLWVQVPGWRVSTDLTLCLGCFVPPDFTLRKSCIALPSLP